MLQPLRIVSALAMVGYVALLVFPAHALFEAGAAKADITPPEGVPLNGYFDRMGRGNIGVHDPIGVRCLYLDDGETNLFLVSADLCLINRELRQRVLELAPPVVPPERIILTATHNHSGTGAMVKPLIARSISGRFMPEMLEMTAAAFASAMQEAYDSRRRGAVGYGSVQQQVLSVNRRFPDGPIDPQIGVIRVDDSDGNAIAVIANFAAHPTSVPSPDAMRVSADYPGFFYTELEKLTNPGCVAMFLNGAEGNQTCANPEKKEGWARTESIGRLLAIRTKEAANSIVPKIATLHVGFAQPALPHSLASSFLPNDTIVQTLEIDDLLIAFVPGEPCVEIGLELRRQALSRGYAAHYTVGLANDYQGYFVPRALYSHTIYESGMNFYGPGIATWFYDRFAELMTRGQPPAPQLTPEPDLRELGPAQHVVLAGDNRAIGLQRGMLFANGIRTAYSRDVLAPLDSGALLPDSAPYAWLPEFVDASVLALPAMGIGARPLLAGLPDHVFDELEGMAEGASLPFDANWLLQSAHVFGERSHVTDRYRSPFCTMVAVAGGRAGAEDLLVARALDWPHPDEPVVLEVRPDDGHAFVSVGFPWNVGVFTGMNEAGLVVSAERVDRLGEPGIDGPPVEIVLRAVLQTSATASAARAALERFADLRGYAVLLASAGVTPEAVVVELGTAQVAREPVDGLLLGQDIDRDDLDDDSRARYGRALHLLHDERIVSVEELQRVLSDGHSGVPGRTRILNADTRHAVVFEPKRKRILVAFPDETGALAFHTLTLGGDGA